MDLRIKLITFYYYFSNEIISTTEAMPFNINSTKIADFYM